MPQTTLLLLLLATTSACASSKAPADEAPVGESSDVVALTFAWPENASGSIAREHFEQDNDAPGEVTSVVYSIATTPEGSGTRVTFSDPRDIVMPGATPEELATVVPMFEAVPTLLLEKGAVTSIGNTDAMRRLLDAIAPIPSDASPEVRARLEQVRTDEFMLQGARTEWWTLTALWAGQSLAVGKPIASKSKMQILGMPDLVESDVSVELKEKLPCPGAEDRSCVRLFYSSAPDSEAMARGVAWVAEEASRKGSTFEVASFERRATTELITEPSTLVPFWFQQIESTALEATDNGKPVSHRLVKRRTETYTWK